MRAAVSNRRPAAVARRSPDDSGTPWAVTEHFGHVASADGTASLGVAVVAAASEEAWQAPQFDEYVICSKGSIEFLHGNGEKSCIAAGQVRWGLAEACLLSSLLCFLS